ncbi:MAG: ABC transporter permease [Agriterribacter sp.]
MSSLFIIIKAEALKTRRTAAMWITLMGAAFIPFISFLIYVLKPDHFLKVLSADPWQAHIYQSWQSASVFLLPMYVILTTSLIVQIEYRNNTWKQVYASPISYADIYFSKFIVIQVMILSCFLLFNIFLIASGYAASWVNAGYHFTQKAIPFNKLLLLSGKLYLSSLAITSIQYWLSLRLKNYIAPLGIGLALLITGLILLQWEKIYYYPYAYTALSFFRGANPGAANELGKNEWYSLIWFSVILLFGFIDTIKRKEHG